MSVNNNVKINEYDLEEDLEEYCFLQDKKALKKFIKAEKSGARIRDLLTSNNISQEKLMEILNRNSKETMTNVLNGKSVYDLRDYLIMTKLFNVSFDYICGISDFKSTQEMKTYHEKNEEKMIDYLKHSGYKEVTISKEYYIINGRCTRTDNLDEYLNTHPEIYESRLRTDYIVELTDSEENTSYISLNELYELFNDCLSNIKRRSEYTPYFL